MGDVERVNDRCDLTHHLPRKDIRLTADSQIERNAVDELSDNH